MANIALAIGGGGTANTSPDKVARTTVDGVSPTYTAGFTLNLAANPTDIVTLTLGIASRKALIRRISIRLRDDTGGIIVPVSLILRAGGNTGGTSTNHTMVKRDPHAANCDVTVAKYTANPSALGSGGVTDQYREAKVGTATAPGDEVVFDFSRPGVQPLALRSILDTNTRVLAINLGGTAMGANPKAEINIELVEEPVRRIILFGDSLIQAASNLQASAANLPGLLGNTDLRFYGNTGKRMLDLLPISSATGMPAVNTAGINYSLSVMLAETPAYGINIIQPEIVNHFLTNDVRTGYVTLAQAIDLLAAFVYVCKVGCTNGAQWTSDHPDGAGTVFSWNATVVAKPHAKLWFWGPNSYLADDPGTTGNISNAGGSFVGANLAAWSQEASTMVREAHAAMAGYVPTGALSGVAGVFQAQDYVSAQTGYTFGRTVKTAANNPLMTDNLHANATGQYVKLEQLAGQFGLA